LTVVELLTGFVPADADPPGFVSVGVDVPVVGLGELVAFPEGLPLGSVTGDPPGPARSDSSPVLFPSVNGSLTMLAAAKPTLTEATAKTAHRATSVTLLDTANLRTC
jgi:hypothetical protein